MSEDDEQWCALLGMTAMMSGQVRGGIFVHGSRITVETETGECTFWDNTPANRACLVAMHMSWLEQSVSKPREGLANDTEEVPYRERQD